MIDFQANSRFFVGWDVGGWNCDRNPVSRDAIAILDESLAVVGKPWRGSLRKPINESTDTRRWISKLFELCGAELPAKGGAVTLAIDTPLGFASEFVQLVAERRHAGPLNMSNTNPYLFRRTERWLFEKGLTPLSAVKDMIGSQATKGMHVLARFAPVTASIGVWSGGELLKVIETYPAACAGSPWLRSVRKRFSPFGHADLNDALICALVAHAHATRCEALAAPSADVSPSEGWIWIPTDVVPDLVQPSGGAAAH